MKKCLLSIVSAALCLSLVMTPFVPVAAAYADEGLLPRAAKSTSETTTTKITIYPFERGRCTDSYSKAWCDSHGFANNRTVPHKVKLNVKEESCLRDPYLAGTAEVIAGLVTTGPGGGLFATAMTSCRLFTCMF